MDSSNDASVGSTTITLLKTNKVIFLDIDGVLVTTRSFIANRGKRLFDCTFDEVRKNAAV